MKHLNYFFGKLILISLLITNSSFSQIYGHTFNIDIEMKGADLFKQSIINSDGSKTIEEYQRLEK